MEKQVENEKRTGKGKCTVYSRDK